MRSVLALLCGALLVLCVELPAQTGSSASTSTATAAVESLPGIGSGTGMLMGGNLSCVPGLPYTLTETTTNIRTLGDGTRITNVRQEIRMRDDAGRTRKETFRVANGTATLQQVELYDPATRTMTMLLPAIKMAHVTEFPAFTPPAPEQRAELAAARERLKAQRASQPQPSGPRMQIETERLGSKSIAGVYAEGRRTTRIIPIGLEGNDREMRMVTETWTSPDLRVELDRSSEDPRMGTSSTVVTNLDRSNPDPALFQVPADYKVSRPNRMTVP